MTLQVVFWVKKKKKKLDIPLPPKELHTAHSIHIHNSQTDWITGGYELSRNWGSWRGLGERLQSMGDWGVVHTFLIDIIMVYMEQQHGCQNIDFMFMCIYCISLCISQRCKNLESHTKWSLKGLPTQFCFMISLWSFELRQKCHYLSNINFCCHKTCQPLGLPKAGKSSG